MNQFDWGNKKEGKPIRTYTLTLVNGDIVYMVTNETLDEVKKHNLGKYLSQGLVMRIVETTATDGEMGDGSEQRRVEANTTGRSPSGPRLKSEHGPLLTGFTRAVVDDRACDTCRSRDGSLVMDAMELTMDCTSEGGCRCVAVPVEG